MLQVVQFGHRWKMHWSLNKSIMLLCAGSSCAANQLLPVDALITRFWVGVISCGGNWTFVVDPLNPVRGDGFSMEWTVIWGIWRPGQHLKPFFKFLWSFLSCFVVWQVAVTCRRLHCHEGLYLVHNSVWMSVACQDPRFPSRKLHCNEMINATCIT